MSEVKNLDAIINKIGFEIAQIIDETMINKILGVLANDGVYAMWVYCLDKLDWKYTEEEEFKKNQLYKFIEQLNKLPVQIEINSIELKVIHSEFNKIFDLIKEINKLSKEIKNIKDKDEKKKKMEEKQQKEKERNKILNKFFWKLSNDIHQLLFFKDIVEKALIYARYHAKTMD